MCVVISVACGDRVTTKLSHFVLKKLFSLRMRCEQYECESPKINCEGEDLEPVCDTSNVQHPHMCSLHQQGRQLLHRGYCAGSCNATTGIVCGANGELNKETFSF